MTTSLRSSSARASFRRPSIKTLVAVEGDINKGAEMSARRETLEKARERMIEERDAHAKVLAAPFDRDKAERARNKFIELQTLIDALDRAIVGDKAISS